MNSRVALGSRIQSDRIVRLPSLGYDDGDKCVDMQVVGVIRGERVQRNLRLSLEPVAYVPLLQAPRREVNLIVRTNTDSSAVAAVDPRGDQAHRLALGGLERADDGGHPPADGASRAPPSRRGSSARSRLSRRF